MPESARPAPTAGKLRRNRKFAGDASIQSRLPSADNPQSRIVRPKNDHESAGFLDARGRTEAFAQQEISDAIICGNSASVMSLMPEQTVSCAVTSPPYWHMVDYGYEAQIGQGSYDAYRQDLIQVWKGLDRVLMPNGKFALNVPIIPLRKEVSEKYLGKTHTRQLLDLYSDLKQDILENTSLTFYSLYIWEKQTTEKMFGSYPYPPNLYERNYIEFVAVFVKPGAPRKLPPAVKDPAKLTQDEWLELTKQIWWMYPENVGRNEGHPAPFPEALPNRLINMYTFPQSEESGYSGDLVLDPFSGWGTTAVAAKRLSRRFVGIDLSPEFSAYASKRLIGVPRQRVVMRAERSSKKKQEAKA
jgi:DNA modification methylase